MYAAILIVHGVLNSFGVRIVAFLSDVSAWWHMLGVLTIAIVLFFVPSHHASASFIFTKFENKSTLGVPIYVFMLGLLMAQYTFTGYDASAHMSEETHNADLAAPRGIVSSIVVSLIAGWILILAITSVIPTHHADLRRRGRQHRRPGRHLAVGALPTRGRAPVAHRRRRPGLLRHGLGDGQLPHAVRLQPGRGRARAQVLAPHQPAYQDADQLDLVLRRLRLHSGHPLAVERASPTGPSCPSPPSASTSPTCSPPCCDGCRARAGRVVAGHSGRWSPLVGWVGIIWVAFISVLFLLPEVGFSTITWHTFNYAPIAVGVVLLFSGGYWLLSARKWFTGPKVQGDADGAQPY